MKTPEGFQLVPEGKCLVCGYTLNAVAEKGADPSNTTRPQEDDLTLCIECYTPLLFNKDLTLRLLNSFEKEALNELIEEATAQLVFMKRMHNE